MVVRGGGGGGGGGGWGEVVRVLAWIGSTEIAMFDSRFESRVMAGVTVEV